MSDLLLSGKSILVTGGARRVGRILALACAREGADIILHYGRSKAQALKVQKEITSLGRRAWIISADLGDAKQVTQLTQEARKIGKLYGLVNSAAIFEPLSLEKTTLSDWERHLAINLTAPFLLSQAFAKQIPKNSSGRIINILDWRALRPGADHFPYTISKAGLAALTKSLAVDLAPRITVNGLALGAILPPTKSHSRENILRDVPLGRWAQAHDLEKALIFLLAGASYITGEIIHVDGGRHLV